VASKYVQCHLLKPNDATIATSNRLGRDEAESEESESDSDTGLKRHDLQEDVSQATALVIYDLEEDCQSDHQDVASAAIDFLPDFAFYMCN